MLQVLPFLAQATKHLWSPAEGVESSFPLAAISASISWSIPSFIRHRTLNSNITWICERVTRLVSSHVEAISVCRQPCILVAYNSIPFAYRSSSALILTLKPYRGAVTLRVAFIFVWEFYWTAQNKSTIISEQIYPELCSLSEVDLSPILRL
jgi:hypothetical protein